MPEEPAQEMRRRLPSVARSISEIGQTDIRVCVLGTIIGRQGDSVILDDGTGSIRVSLDGDTELEPGSRARVFGRVLPADNGLEIQGDIMQDMKNLDIELYSRVLEKLKERGGVSDV